MFSPLFRGRFAVAMGYAQEDRWSTEGAQLLTDTALDPGTWCAVSHTSIFAVAQTVPFGSALELTEANGSWACIS